MTQILNVAYISAGSNFNKRKNITGIISILKKKFSRIKFTAVYETEYEGKGAQENYYNFCAKVLTKKNLPQLYFYFKKLQKIFGRKKSDKKKGMIPLDIDFLLFNNSIDPQYKIPYTGMEKDAYRMFILAKIAADIMLPHTGKPVCYYAKRASKSKTSRMKKILL